MNYRKHIFTWWLAMFVASNCLAQFASLGEEYSPDARNEEGMRIMFYNVENLFDTFNDLAINDDEFTPDGEKNWSFYRYRSKLNKIAKTIIAVGGWEPPAVVGLCEIENFQVLMDLTTDTPLNAYGYQIIHENSRDTRGIDVALLYRPEKLTKLAHKSIHIEDASLVTRDILCASFTFLEKDTIHLFVNHWPSRVGGKEFTEAKRIKVASVLKSAIDSISTRKKSAKIVVMGDFNDEPNDQSMMVTLNAILPASMINERQLYNLTFQDLHYGRGTLVYKEIDHTWFLFDQMIVTGAAIEGAGLLTKGKKNVIFKPDWLLENDRPFRTYQGPIYRGGFSDHLPIYLDLYYKNL